jgi:hypothetical protein
LSGGFFLSLTEVKRNVPFYLVAYLSTNYAQAVIIASESFSCALGKNFPISPKKSLNLASKSHRYCSFSFLFS